MTIDTPLLWRTATQALSAGNIAAAHAAAVRLVNAHPDNARAHQLMGVVHGRAGRPADAAISFRRAISTGGDTLDNHLNLARALAAGGDVQAAIGIAAPWAGKDAGARRLLADLEAMAPQPSAGLAVLEDLVARRPDDASALIDLARAQIEVGATGEAVVNARKAVAIAPRDGAIVLGLGHALEAAGDAEEACRMFEQAAILRPHDAEPLLALGRALVSIDEGRIALAALGAAARLAPADPRIFHAIGLAHADLLDQPNAERALRYAIRLAPKQPHGYLDLGILLEKGSRPDELNTLIADACGNGVFGPEIDFLEALLLTRRGEDEKALAKAGSIRSPTIHPAQVAELVGRLADRLGRTSDALEAYTVMNAAMADSPQGRRANPAGYRGAVVALTERTTPAWHARWAPTPPAGRRAPPAFLVGFPRSGTTLLDTLLMGHPGTHVLEELPIIETLAQSLGDDAIDRLTSDQVAELRDRYFAELDRLNPAPQGALVIDKNPLSMTRLPLIHRLFPDARVILAVRHPCDVVLSCWMQNFKVTSVMANFLTLADGARAYDLIFTYFERCREVLPIRIHSLRYEDLIEDTQGEMLRLTAFLGLEWTDALLDHRRTARERGYIRTPSYHQVTQPIYRRASGRWEQYREAFGPALETLAPWIERFGYGPDARSHPVKA